MGWFSIHRSGTKEHSSQALVHSFTNDVKAQVAHIEYGETAATPERRASRADRQIQSLEVPFQDSIIPDEKLPYISPDQVRKQRSEDPAYGEKRLWIVVDNVIYDCTDFISEHPGGDTVIQSFIGEDCSWQFWRFHSDSIMREFGRPLRIGRTEGVKNRFIEPPRYFGLSKLGHDNW